MPAQAKSKPKLVRTKSGSLIPESLVIDGATQASESSRSMVPNTEKPTVTNKPTGDTSKQEVVQKTTPTTKPEPKTETKEDHARHKNLTDYDEEDEIPLEVSNKKVYMVSLFLTIIIISVAAIVFWQRSRIPVEKVSEPVVEVSREVVEAAPVDSSDNQASESARITKDIQLERSEIKLEVLNGSGVTGAAGKVASTFEELGYLDISAGNSDETIVNELYVKKDIEDQVDLLLKDVRIELGIKKITAELDADADFDARIVLGLGKEEDETPTPTVTEEEE